MRIWDVCVVVVVVVVMVDSMEIGNSGRVKGSDCCGAKADGRRWSQVVAGGSYFPGLVARFTNYGRQTRLILINLILWWRQGKPTPSASGKGRGRSGCKQI
jgi:hypothetical protein